MGAAAVAFNDLAGSVVRLPLALRLAMDDIHGKYRRTVLGPLWIVLAQAASVAGFLLVFSGLFKLDPEVYAVYLAAGFPVWALISTTMSDMPVAFIGAKGFIESFGLPWLVHIWRRRIGNASVVVRQLVILFAVMAWLQKKPTVEMLSAIPALFILTIAATGFGILLAMFGARYRDLQPAMQMIAGFLFMFSPVMWHREQLTDNQWVVEYNPLYYFIRVLRDPLLGKLPPTEIWVGTAAGAVLLFVIGCLAYLVGRRRLYHWL